MSQDSPPLVPVPSPVPARSVRVAVAWWGTAAVFARIAGRFAPLTAPAELASLLAGGAIMAWALGVAFTRPVPLPVPVPVLQRREAPESLGGRGWMAWVVVLVAFGVLEVHSLVSSTPLDHPSLSAISRPLLAPSDHRSLGYLLWLASGVWVARR